MSKILGKKRILILAPHTDDGEFGCGASIAKHIENGDEVFCAAFSSAEESLPPSFPKGILRKEIRAAMNILGVSEQNLILYEYKVRYLSYHRQEILEELVKINKEISPNLIYMPSLNDLHQDHLTVANEGLRAFKKKSILGYELPWNNLNFTTQCFNSINENQLNKKILALDCYNSQKGRLYVSEDFVRALAITRGTQIGVKYAETFEVVRWVF